MVFNSAGRAPGVYIQEIEVPGPIAGVSTGVLAVIGPAKSGPINTPTFVTNWTQFKDTFGDYIYDPPVYAAHAVRGFFDNGGSLCCFVRASKAKHAWHEVVDCSAGRQTVFKVTARQEGKQGDGIAIAIREAQLCETEAKKCAATVEVLSEDKLSLLFGNADDVKPFIAGDIVQVSQGALTEVAEVAFVSAPRKEIVLKYALVKAFSTDKVDAMAIRLDDLQGKTRVRLNKVDGLEPGSYLSFAQAGGGGLSENAAVESIVGDAVVLRAPLQKNFSLSAAAEDVVVTSLEFSLDVSNNGKIIEVYENLSPVPYHSRFYEKMTADSRLVLIAAGDIPNTSPPPLNLPDCGYPQNNASLKEGANDSPGGLTPGNYKDALKALEKAAVNIVCIPDSVSFDPDGSSVRKMLVEHCESMADRFAILDCGRGLSVEGVLAQRGEYGGSSYAAAYYPWIEISHPAGLGRLKVPPSGHIAGVYARTDDAKGVHKAPGNEVIWGCLGTSAILDDTEHGMLNEASVNAIVTIPGDGVTLMGARTLYTKGTQWRYINVRRLLLYIEKSIQNATRFAVFLPNNPSLWAAVKRQVSDFLYNIWRSGALFGTSSSQAFYVKVDEELNPASTRALGQLIIEVVLYPVTPAEFIVFRIIQQPGGPSVSED